MKTIDFVQNTQTRGISDMLTDLEIAQQAEIKEIVDIAKSLGISKDDLDTYGKYKAKVSLDAFGDKKAKLILVTAINPTPAGEGKSTTTIGLGDAFHKLGYKTCIALREPSFGPVLGVKGGAAGGGYAQVIPMEDIKASLSRDLYRLYQLIWKRFVASRMESAAYKTVKETFDANGVTFTSSSSKLFFQGYMTVYSTEEDKIDENDGNLSGIKEGAELSLKEMKKEQHFTQPPAHFTEASLVKTLEELRIGRPSTYAPTITTILTRHYIVKDKKNLYTTDLGEAVNSIMDRFFPEIVNTEFTALMEDTLDSVETGDVDWKTIVRNFYPDLEVAVEKAGENLEKVKIMDEETDIICDQCGRKMVFKYGPHGKFLACPGFPECRNTKSYNEKTEFVCPKCGGAILIMKTRKGRRYYSCENHPDCDYMSWQKPENA